jgi:hypothetical protein
MRIGQPRKSSSELTLFIEARTLQNQSIFGVDLGAEIAEEFRFHVLRTTINVIRSGRRFKYRPARHNQAPHPDHIEARVAFGEKMLRTPECLDKIHFSDELRLVLGDDKRWIWYRYGEDNPAA